MNVRPAIVFAAGLGVRLWLIHAFPIVFGGDTILRLANRDRILLAYQLPLLQSLIWGLSQITTDLWATRLLMALIGAAAGVGFYLLAAHFVDRARASWAALLLTTNPFLIELSIVPYQEVLMLAALCFAFHFYLARRLPAASVALGLACLTRYEAWAACPVLALAHAGLTRRLPVSALLFGWAPLGWIVLHLGLSPGGTFVAEWPATFGRLVRYLYLAWITLKNTPAPVWVLAAFGLLERPHDRRLRTLAVFFVLFLLSIPFSAHGESPDPERRVTAREATLWIAAVAMAAGFARTRWLAWIAALGIAWGVFDAHRFLRRDTSEPHLRLSYRLARYIDGAVRERETAVILARPMPPELMRNYLDKVARRGGEPALRQARRVLESMDTSPPDYQRTLVHSRIGRHRLLSRPAPGAAWWFVWSDAPNPPPASGMKQVETLSEGALRVVVYHSEP